MSLTDLVKGFQMGWKYPNKESRDKTSITFEDETIILDDPIDDYFFDRIFEEKALKSEIAGFYTALVVKYPRMASKAFYEELRKNLGRYLIK